MSLDYTAIIDRLRWPNFSAPELACMEGLFPARLSKPCRYCGGVYKHEPDFLDGLQYLRDDFGAPIIIDSGYRCPSASVRVGGIAYGPHYKMAADIRTAGMNKPQRQKLFSAAVRAGFTGFGFYPNFLHVDMQRARSWPVNGAVRFNYA